MGIGSEFTSFPRGRDPVRLVEDESNSRNSRDEKLYHQAEVGEMYVLGDVFCDYVELRREM